MSRIGKSPIPVPTGVTVTLAGDLVKVKGPKGELARTLPPGVTAKLDGGTLTIFAAPGGAHPGAIHGLTRTLVANLVTGVSTGYTRVLEIEGVGYRAASEGGKLTMTLGFTHPIHIQIPKMMEIVVDKAKQNILTLTSPDKALLGQFAADLRSLRPPEPYKGKGVRYQGEYIRRKAGKAGKAGAKA